VTDESTRVRWDTWNASGGPRYPHAKIVQFTFRNFPHREDREASQALDLGCGGGVHTVFLAAEGFHVSAIDISPVGIETTRSRLRDSGLQAVELRVGSIEEPPVVDEGYALVVSSGVLDSAGPRVSAAAIPRVARTMAAGGRGVFVFASDRDERLSGDNRWGLHGYTRAEVDSLFAGAFAEVFVDRYITTYGGGRTEHNDWLVTVRR
jgi:SAM-dependent methyltransferase